MITKANINKSIRKLLPLHIMKQDILRRYCYEAEVLRVCHQL